MDKKELGRQIKARRKNLGLTQAELARGICSQPLLSHIEAGDYMPAADILIGLYQKLGLSENQLVLQNYFPISPIKSISQRCEQLCRKHQYKELQDFLLADRTVSEISDENLQAYYYYLGVACAQLGELAEAKQHLKLARAESRHLNTLARLSLASLAVISSTSQQTASCEAYLAAAFEDLESQPYDENLNVLFYLKAAAQKRLGQEKAALMTLEAGIAFSASHDSHYLLANFYYLAARLVQADKSQLYQAHSQLFAELYGEKVFQKI